MEYLTAEDILNIHSVMIDETGGSHGVRDQGALKTLEGLPQQQAFGKELYPTLYIKAAVYMRNILFSHPFIDGNKRTAMTCTDVFLQLNGYVINVAKGGVELCALTVIEKHSSLEEIAIWIELNTYSI
jgi:death-on-curing protein